MDDFPFATGAFLIAQNAAVVCNCVPGEIPKYDIARPIFRPDGQALLTKLEPDNQIGRPAMIDGGVAQPRIVNGCRSRLNVFFGIESS